MALFALWRDDVAACEPAALHRRLADECHVVPERTIARAIDSRAGRWHLATFACATRFYPAERQVWSAPGEGACVLNGVAWRDAAGRTELLDAAALAGLLAKPDATLPDDVAGEYAVARLLPDGTLLALADPAGAQQLFHRPDRPFAAANRAAFLAVLADDRAPEPEAGLWLAAIGYRAGAASAWRGVEQVPQAHALVTGRGLRPLARPDHFDGPRGFAAGGEALLEEGRAQAIAAIRLAAGDHSVALPVTGGKDSRAVLALALAAGLREQLTLVTRGPAEHPDVCAARALAAELGLPHRREPPRIAVEPGVAGFVERLATHAYQTDGGMGGWDLLVGGRPGRDTLLTGHMGEVLKSHRVRTPDPADPTDMVRQQAPFDPLDLLRPEACAALAERLRAQQDAALAEGAATDDLPDLFYYRNRVPNWLGGIRGVRGHEAQPVMPLGVPALQRLAFRLTAAERAAELIHYRLVRDCAPALLALPFAHQSWPAALGHVPRPAPLLAAPGAALFGNWQWALNHAPELRAWLSSFVRAADIPLWEGLDRALLLQRLRNRRFDYADAVAILGLVVAAFHQGAMVRQAKLGAADDPAWRPSPLVHAASAVLVEGHVDIVEGAAVRIGSDRLAIAKSGSVTLSGWAVAPDWPGAAPAIEARADGRLVATARPTRDRSDLVALGLPHTVHGFVLTIPVEALGDVGELTVGHGAVPFARLAVAAEVAA